MLSHIREIEIPYLIRAANNIIKFVMQVIYPRFFHADNIEMFIIKSAECSVAFFPDKRKCFAATYENFHKILK